MSSNKNNISRRQVLKTSSAAVAGLTATACNISSPDQPATPVTPVLPPDNPTVPAKFLSEKEHDTLHALVSRLIPTDVSPGAAEACVADFIDAYLAAFLTSPAFIYAGAPFSGRGDHPVNEFEEFIPLDPYEEQGWRTTVEGSQGLSEREFNGSVKGLQQIYRKGLARLNERAEEQGSACFSELTTTQQDTIIADTSDGTVVELINHAFPDTLNGMYGAPEYLGNKDLTGWGFTAYDGDVQPRGYTTDQVVNADAPEAQATAALLPASFHENASNKSLYAKRTKPSPLVVKNNIPAATLPVVPSADDMSFILANCEGNLSKLKAMMAGYQQQLLTANYNNNEDNNHA